MLKSFGFDEDAEQVYLAMLECRGADVDEIAAVAGISVERARAALSALAGCALLHWDASEETEPRLIDPGIALDALFSRQEAELAARRQRLEENRLAITQLLAAREVASDVDQDLGIERYESVAAVRLKLDELARTCQREVWSFNPGGPQSQENLAKSREANEKSLQRGVRMRAIYLDSVRNDVASVEHIDWLTEMGAEVCTTPTLPIRMLIVDRAIAVLPIDERDGSKGALVVSGRGMVAGLVALFDATWATAQPFGPRQCRAAPDKPNSQEIEVLRLWARGATDAAAARSLGISERTVRRMSDSLSRRLASTSRFETAARAMALGWITSEDLA